MSGTKSATLPQDGVMPVIHLQSIEQAIDMAGMAKDAGASGAWLIDHNWPSANHPEILGEAFVAVQKAHPKLWLGVNCLTLPPARNIAFGTSIGAEGVWVDDAIDVNRNGEASETDYALIDEIRGDICYFGGIAMKGFGYIEDPMQAARKIAENYRRVDVAVTSGPNTGKPTSSDRLKTIRIALGPEKKLGVASGVNAENVGVQARIANYLLVASSIETEPMSGQFDEARLRELIEQAAVNVG